MAVDKAINRAPLGLDATLAAGAIPGVNVDPEMELEIVLEDDDAVEEEIGIDSEEDDEFNENLAEILDDGQLTELAGDLIGDFDEDISSRKDLPRAEQHELRAH